MAAPMLVGPACSEVVDAYERIVTVLPVSNSGTNAAASEALRFRNHRLAQHGNIRVSEQEAKMKLSISLSALLIAGFVVASSEPASAVVYCQYISYPAGCVVRPGVRLVARPVARAVVTPGVGAAGVGVRAGTPMNRGGPVNRVGRR